MSTEAEIENQAKGHALACARCMYVLVRYRYRIHRPWSTVPDAVASEVRAALCKEGAEIVDRILLKGAP